MRPVQLARAPRTPLVMMAFIALAGCSHTFFQFYASPGQRNEIAVARNALVSSAGNPAAMAQVVDLDGRRAVETLLAGMTVESTAADPQYQSLVRALYLGVMPDSEDPLGAIDSDLTLIAARVAQRVGTHMLGQVGLGLVANLLGAATDTSAQRLAEMQASLARSGLGECADLQPIISYNAGILGHIHSQLAEQDPTYLAWRGRVQAVHLVRWQGPRNHVLMVLTSNAGEAGLRVIGWHGVSPQQWASLEPRLRRALDLP